MEAANCSLRVNRLLLDPKFESYKLSLDPLPCYGVDLDVAVAEVKLRDDQYTLDHVRAYGMYNYLHRNPWCPDSVLYVDQLGRVLNMALTLDTTLGKPAEVFRFPSDLSACDRRLCSSMHFTSSNWVTLSDGTGSLYLVHVDTLDQSSSGKWELRYNQELGDPFVVLHSVLYISAELKVIDVLLLNVEKNEMDVKGSGFHVSLEWISIALPSQDDGKCEILKRRKLRGKSVPHYAAIEPDGNGLMIISYMPFRFLANEQNQAEEDQDGMEQDEMRDPLYQWQQTADDVTLSFSLPDGLMKEDIKIHFAPTHIDVALKEREPFLEGKLYSSIDHESSTWVLKDERSVEVTLLKRDVGCMWAEVIIGDKRGEFVADPTQAATIADQLMHLTSDELNPDPDGEKPPCNAQELEECDVSLEDCATLSRFDGNTLKPTHVVNLGSNQFLFSVMATPELMPCFSLRHDVDALLWQPVSAQDNTMWEHAATFNALGYVQASKRDKKFFTCAPDFSYAALCECVRRIFIYRQPSQIDTVLYNRKEGRHVGQVAKQQVASLETSDPILGFQASNERLFVLTTKKLFVIRVNSAD